MQSATANAIGIKQKARTHRRIAQCRGLNGFSATFAIFHQRSESLKVRQFQITTCSSLICQRLRDNTHSPTANEAIVPAIVVVKHEGQEFGPSGLKESQRPLFDLCFDAAAAERPALAAVGENQHRRAGFLRRRAARFHQRTENARPTVFQRCQNFRQDFPHHVAVTQTATYIFLALS